MLQLNAKIFQLVLSSERDSMRRKGNEDFDIELNCFLTLLKNLIEVLQADETENNPNGV